MPGDPGVVEQSELRLQAFFVTSHTAHVSPALGMTAALSWNEHSLGSHLNKMTKALLYRGHF